MWEELEKNVEQVKKVAGKMVEEKEKEEQEKKVAENQKEEEKKVANKSIPPDKDFPNYIIVKNPANPVSEDPSEEQ
jgi:hypothetical protein